AVNRYPWGLASVVIMTGSPNDTVTTDMSDVIPHLGVERAIGLMYLHHYAAAVDGHVRYLAIIVVATRAPGNGMALRIHRPHVAVEPVRKRAFSLMHLYRDAIVVKRHAGRDAIVVVMASPPSHSIPIDCPNVVPKPIPKFCLVYLDHHPTSI